MVADLRERLDRAIHATKVQADVPVGAYLSGGLDSTAVVAGSRPIHTFTVRFQDQDRYDYQQGSVAVTSDDTPFAELAARALGVQQTWVRVSQEEMIRDFARLAQINDLLPAVEQEFSQHYLARAASQQVKVILVGDASDETHFGYHFLLDDAVTSSPLGPLRRFGADRRLRFLHPSLVKDTNPLEYLPERYRALASEAGLGWGDAEERRRATTYLIVRRWLAAAPANPLKEAYLWDAAEKIGAVGDWCGGPRIEGAFLSGRALAQSITP